MSAEILLSKKFFRLLAPILGIDGHPIKKLVVTLEVDCAVEIELTEYVNMKGSVRSLGGVELDPSHPPMGRYCWNGDTRDALLNKLIAVVEGRDDQT